MGNFAKQTLSSTSRASRSASRHLKAEVDKVIASLGLTNAQRVLVSKCEQCPCLREAPGRLDCKLGAAVAAADHRPPRGCPLRKGALSVAIDPEA